MPLTGCLSVEIVKWKYAVCIRRYVFIYIICSAFSATISYIFAVVIFIERHSNINVSIFVWKKQQRV